VLVPPFLQIQKTPDSKPRFSNNIKDPARLVYCKEMPGSWGACHFCQL